MGGLGKQLCSWNLNTRLLDSDKSESQNKGTTGGDPLYSIRFLNNLWFSIFLCYAFSMARVLLDNEEFYVTSTITGKFKVTTRNGAFTRKTNRTESLHFHSIIDCLKFLDVPMAPNNEIFKDAISTFATSLLGNGNGAYRDYFGTPPHELAYRIAKKSW